LEGVGVREIDRVGLVGVFCDICEMEAEGFAEPAELDLAVVVQAKFECLNGNRLEKRVNVSLS
jgi:hypothetical protein